MAATEYVNVTRDTAWLDKWLPYAVDHSGQSRTLLPTETPIPVQEPPQPTNGVCVNCCASNLPCCMQCVLRVAVAVGPLLYWVAQLCCCCSKRPRNQRGETFGTVAGSVLCEVVGR